ncbi:hypothetical protein HYV56_02370 [Candidatus Peregrinibacteria bacterium]|nr:hypothetical protein [Candidatus Peregrinibacteria bacterium]
MKNFLSFAEKIAESAGKKLLQNFRKENTFTRGTPKEVKSLYDKIADDIIKRALEKNYKNHSYLTEETGLIQKNNDLLWIIDPLDGTGNFVNGNPFFSVSIALWIKGEPIISVIEAPALQERYIAKKNEGAWIYDLKTGKKRKAQVSRNTKIEKSYFIFCEGGIKNKAEMLPFINDYYPRTKDMRKLGSASLELAWVGAGRSESYATFAISIWDIAAGILFVKEAGGEIFDFKLKKYNFKDLLKIEEIDMIATNGYIKMKPKNHSKFSTSSISI